jgi:hypothetical protein
VRRHLGGAVFATVIPRSVRLSEAPSYGQSIATYRADSKGAEAYAAFAAEYLRRSTGGSEHNRDATSAVPSTNDQGSPRTDPMPARHNARQYVGVEG